MITIKDPSEIELMRYAGGIVGELLERMAEKVKPGVTTASLDQFAEDFLVTRGLVPAFLGYNGYPATICASVNEEVVHGIPGSRKLLDGDIIGIDVAGFWKGYCADAAVTVPVGDITPENRRLLAVARESLMKGIAAARPGVRLGSVSHAIQRHAEENGFSVVRKYVGHGIGRQMHEDPQVPNVGHPDRGPMLVEGMTLAVEPMVNMGGYDVVVKSDHWTVVTRDGKLSAHFEHTIAITGDGAQILTKV
ncbi:MAG: type I methionyl aminopeptidase [Solirubrobacterales bacterium]